MSLKTCLQKFVKMESFGGITFLIHVKADFPLNYIITVRSDHKDKKLQKAKYLLIKKVEFCKEP